MEEEGKRSVSSTSCCHSPLWGRPQPGAYTVLRGRLCGSNRYRGLLEEHPPVAGSLWPSVSQFLGMGPLTWHTAQSTHPGRPRLNQPAARGPALPSATGFWVSPPPRALGTLQNPAPSAVLPPLGQGAPSPNGPGLTGTTLLPPRPAGGSGLER